MLKNKCILNIKSISNVMFFHNAKDTNTYPKPPKLRRQIAGSLENHYISSETGEIIVGNFDLKDKSNADLQLINDNSIQSKL